MKVAGREARAERVGVKRVQRDIDVQVRFQLLLDEFRRGLAEIGCLVVRELHTGELLRRHARCGEQRARLRDVELLCRREIGSIAAHPLGDEGLRGYALALKDLCDECVAIDGGRDRLPHLHVVRGRSVGAKGDPEHRQRRRPDDVLLQLVVARHACGLSGLHVDRVQLPVLVFGQRDCAVVDDVERDRG